MVEGMEYRTLGRSGVVVSTLALGTMTFGNETDEAGSHAQLDAFLEAGGTLHRHRGRLHARRRPSRSSGAGCRRLDGGARPGRPRDQGPLPDGRRRRTTWVRRAGIFAAPWMRRSSGCGVDHIDLYQLHAWDPVTPLEETLAFLDDAVRAGQDRATSGCRTSPAGSCRRRATSSTAAGWAPLVTLQPQYNLLVREIEWEIVPACQENGLGLLPWSPLGGGWLTGKYAKTSTRPARPGSARTRTAVSSPTTAVRCRPARGTWSKPYARSPKRAAAPWRRSP